VQSLASLHIDPNPPSVITVPTYEIDGKPTGINSMQLSAETVYDVPSTVTEAF
jgi:hypothetical protein